MLTIPLTPVGSRTWQRTSLYPSDLVSHKDKATAWGVVVRLSRLSNARWA